MRFYRVVDSGVAVKFPARLDGEMSIVIVEPTPRERSEQIQRDLFDMLNTVRRLLEADLGRV